MNSYDINVIEINVALEKLKKSALKSKRRANKMSNNFYMMEQIANGINTDRRSDANAYRLWRKALQSIQDLRQSRQRALANGR